MCSQKTGRACGTSGSRELCGSGVREKRATRLQAGGIGTIDVSLSHAKSGAGRCTARTAERIGGEAHAVRLPTADGDAGAGRSDGQSQARVPAVSGGRIGDEDSAPTANPLGGYSSEAEGEPAERTMVDGFRQ